jgi:tRNA pseudouridine38-40 synthase
MARRLQLIVAYDGGPFAGWQSQTNANGIQDHLEKAVAKVSGQATRIHGAGRTDAGVHARGQSAHFDPPETRLSPDNWMAALNDSLPPTIRILRCRAVASTFHARFSAREKIYRYRIWSGKILPPFELGRAWHVISELDRDRMTEAAGRFAGRHDFKAFAANRGHSQLNTVRTLTRMHLQQSSHLVVVTLEGDGFLYKMARLIVGSIVACGRGVISSGQLQEMMQSGARQSGWSAAPAAGLYLDRVRY